jgi:hypothetical protein
VEIIAASTLTFHIYLLFSLPVKDQMYCRNRTHNATLFKLVFNLAFQKDVAQVTRKVIAKEPRGNQ